MPEEGDFSAPIDTADKKRQHLPGEDLRQPRVVQARDLMEKKTSSILGIVKTIWRWGTSRRSDSRIHSPHSSKVTKPVAFPNPQSDFQFLL